MGNQRERLMETFSGIEEAFEEKDKKFEEQRQFWRLQHRHFGKRITDHISGRPHWLNRWLGGILSGLGPRRK